MEETSPTTSDRDQLWRQWAAAAQKGDKKSYALLLKDILPFIRYVLIPRLANPDWAEDVTQDVLLSVHKSLHTYSPDKPFKPWLLAIIHFRRTDFLRKHYSRRGDKQSPVETLDFSGDYVTNPAFAGELKDIEKALQSLPEKQRQVFELVKVKGYTAKEVAEKLGMSVSAVKVSVHRTGKKLRGMLG